MQVVDMMDRYNIGYGSVNHNRNLCLDCGYENAETHLEKCPKCGSAHLEQTPAHHRLPGRYDRPLEQGETVRTERPGCS